MDKGSEQPSEELRFESIKERRGAYLVEYAPPLPRFSFATLDLIFLGPTDPINVVELMQSELRRWLNRYPAALMVSAFDSAGIIIPINQEQKTSLVGWLNSGGEVESTWNLSAADEYLKTLPPHPDWRVTYADIPFRTIGQIKSDADKYLRNVRRQAIVEKIIFALWLSVFPATWAILQYVGPTWLAASVLAYSLFKASRAWLKVIGRIKPSKAEIVKTEKQQKMEHYFYHCERNSAAFARLKSENFETDLRERTREEAAKLATTAPTACHSPPQI
jgi:hypothetical protein